MRYLRNVGSQAQRTVIGGVGGCKGESDDRQDICSASSWGFDGQSAVYDCIAGGTDFALRGCCVTMTACAGASLLKTEDRIVGRGR